MIRYREKLEERRRKRFLAKKNNNLPLLMCSQCGYRTKEKYQFKVHMNNHNGIKDFKYVRTECLCKLKNFSIELSIANP